MQHQNALPKLTNNTVRQMVGVSDREGFKLPGKVMLVKKKLYVSRRFAGSSLGIEIYRFEDSNYHIGEIVTFGGLFYDITREPLVRFCSNKFKKIKNYNYFNLFI